MQTIFYSLSSEKKIMNRHRYCDAILGCILALCIGGVVVAQTQTSVHPRSPIGAAKQNVSDAVSINPDSLPPDFPKITVNASNNPSPGFIFLANFTDINNPVPSYLMRIDNGGTPLTYAKVPTTPVSVPLNFKKQPNGMFSYFQRSNASKANRILDTAFNVVNTYQGRNGYNTEDNDLILLPNGNALMLNYSRDTLDLSGVIEGGHPAADLMQTVIQEVDANRNVVYQWRSNDYLRLTDSYVDTLAASIDVPHGNSICIDLDGHYLISLRHSSEVIKVHRKTGEIIWRLGGALSDFKFIGEQEENAPFYFSFQHHAMRLPNGNLTLFDNGTQHAPQYSRGVEYKIDEVAKTATLVWEYRHSPDIFAGANGSVQRLPNGNTLIGWGQVNSTFARALTEVTADGSIALEMSLPTKQRSFKVFRSDWLPCKPLAVVRKFDVQQGNAYQFNDATQSTGMKLMFNTLTAGGIYNTVIVERNPCSSLNPRFASSSVPEIFEGRWIITQEGLASYECEMRIDLKLLPSGYDPSRMIVYGREIAGEGTFHALPTAFDAFTKELLVSISQFGEFVIGQEEVIQTLTSPVLLMPQDGETVLHAKPIKLRWGMRGRYDVSHVEIAADYLFDQIVLDTTIRSDDALYFLNAQSNKTYYWRVRAMVGVVISDWSDVRSFTPMGVIFSVRNPNGGELWNAGDPYNIRWNANISDSVKIELLRNQTDVTLIAAKAIGLTHGSRSKPRKALSFYPNLSGR